MVQNEDWLTVTENSPTSIVRDFQRFMEYIEMYTPRLTPKNEYINRKDVAEMNNWMTQPLQSVSPNSEQLSYPQLHLFYHLAWDAGLVQKERNKGKLVLKPTDRLGLYRQLNPTEQYITLLETFWVDADWSKLQGGSFGQSPAYTVDMVFEYMSSVSVGQAVHIKTSGLNHLMWDWEYFFHYFHYFGFWNTTKDEEMSDQHGLKRHYVAATVTPTLFMQKLGPVLVKTRNLGHWNIPLRREAGDWRGTVGAPLPYESDEDYVLKDEPFCNALVWLFALGELRGTLPRRIQAFEEGTYLFKVSIDSAWRTMELSAHHTLHDLHNTIQQAFQFGDDHLYAFFMDGRKWSTNSFTSPYDESGIPANKMRIGELDLREGQRILYLFDYGDEWTFQVELQKINRGQDDLDKPKLIKKVGLAPSQYGW